MTFKPMIIAQLQAKFPKAIIILTSSNLSDKIAVNHEY